MLEKVAAWDPFNVTEDADLGIRLARFGYETATILSRIFSPWLQRQSSPRCEASRARATCGLVWHIPLLPFYWALMSLAAWQALFQFFRKPSDWEKTTHGVAQARRAPRSDFVL